MAEKVNQMTALDPDQLDRTVMIAVHDGSAATIEAAEAAHAATGVVFVADNDVCGSINGQAATLTAVATAVRAFGNVHVLLDRPEAAIHAGLHRGVALQDVVKAEGGQLIAYEDVAQVPANWPTVLFGATTVVPRSAQCAPTLRAQWRGWTAAVEPAQFPAPSAAPEDGCVLAAIAAGALVVSEAFNMVLARGGSDAGYRQVALNLWRPGSTDNGPALRYAPAYWWLVGLGHLGQAYSWVLSWLEYEEPSQVQVVLQDTDRTTKANHSTGILTPVNPARQRKTRRVAALLDRVGYDTHIIERRLDASIALTPTDIHVALLGVDNLASRRLISDIGWQLAIETGLGAGPFNFSSIMMRRFPGRTGSADVPGWAESALQPATVPDSPAFDDLRRRTDTCGLTELAGKAVGASFVGAVAATLAVSEAVRELHGGTGSDITTISLDTFDLIHTPATTIANVVSLPLISRSEAE
jgi:hypothetical protein